MQMLEMGWPAGGSIHPFNAVVCSVVEMPKRPPGKLLGRQIWSPTPDPRQKHLKVGLNLCSHKPTRRPNRCVAFENDWTVFQRLIGRFLT